MKDYHTNVNSNRSNNGHNDIGVNHDFDHGAAWDEHSAGDRMLAGDGGVEEQVARHGVEVAPCLATTWKADYDDHADSSSSSSDAESVLSTDGDAIQLEDYEVDIDNDEHDAFENHIHIPGTVLDEAFEKAISKLTQEAADDQIATWVEMALDNSMVRLFTSFLSSRLSCIHPSIHPYIHTYILTDP